MENKFQMTLEDNIFLAKRNIVDIIWKSARLEGLNVTFPDTGAITMMLHLMRRQMFGDGNKRTSMLSANQIMISNGVGIISIPVELQRDFSKMLVEFYETNKMDDIKEFIYHSCIDGIPLQKKESEHNYNPNDDYYLKVSFKEATVLEKNGISFEGTVHEQGNSVIRIKTSDKTKVDEIINSYRNNNSIKNLI